MNTNTIAIIEMGCSHDECLLSQLHAIHSTGSKILLITFAEIFERHPEFEQYIDDRLYIDMSGSKIQRSKEVSRIWKKVKASKCERAIINTAEGNLVRLLCIKALFHKIEFIGIVHNTRKFEKSFTQSIINRKIKKYLMLSENLLNSISPSSRIKVDYFYPLRFSMQKKSIEKNEKTVLIIGGVEERRKDLSGFLELLDQVSSENVKFIFLGKSDERLQEVIEFKNEIERKNLSDKIKLYDHFVSQDEFDIQLQNADLIMPIVHPNTKSAEDYFKSRISGAMCVSFAYKVPMMIHETYENIEEMKTASFYYNMKNFGEQLNFALNSIEEKKSAMKNWEAYNVDVQEKRYLNFISPFGLG